MDTHSRVTVQYSIEEIDKLFAHGLIIISTVEKGIKVSFKTDGTAVFLQRGNGRYTTHDFLLEKLSLWKTWFKNKQIWTIEEWIRIPV